MPFSNNATQKILNLLFNNTPVTPPNQKYAALFITEPTAAGTGTEVSGGGYVRVAISAFSSATIVGGKMTTSNAEAVIFPEATAAWTTASTKINYYAIYDSVVGGNLIGYGALQVAMEVMQGGQPKFETGDITVTLE
ncbi:MAG: hypothetical protein ACERKO_11050 [Acetanaerobacterium sp.]